MNRFKLISRKLTKFGNSYHFVVPKALVEDSDILQEGKEYDLKIVEKEN